MSPIFNNIQTWIEPFHQHWGVQPSTMPSHVHTHKQAGIMALPLDGRFQLKTSYARFLHVPTNNIHAHITL